MPRALAKFCFLRIVLNRAKNNVSALVGITHRKPEDLEMHRVDTVLNLSVIQQAARDEWANTLWANLDVSVLSDGIDSFIKQLKRLPREVKALPLCHILEEKMKEFKNSIPLFSDLKNEALRER